MLNIKIIIELYFPRIAEQTKNTYFSFQKNINNYKKKI